MKIQVFKWKHKDPTKRCNVCGNQAYRTIYNDQKVGLTKPGWYACYRKRCYTWVAFNVLDDNGAPKWAKP